MSSILAVTYSKAFAVTASDTTNDPHGPFAGLYIGGAGNVQLITVDGTPATFNGLAAGVILPVATLRVMSSSTTATGILGLGALPWKGT